MVYFCMGFFIYFYFLSCRFSYSTLCSTTLVCVCNASFDIPTILPTRTTTFQDPDDSQLDIAVGRQLFILGLFIAVVVQLLINILSSTLYVCSLVLEQHILFYYYFFSFGKRRSIVGQKLLVFIFGQTDFYYVKKNDKYKKF